MIVKINQLLHYQALSAHLCTPRHHILKGFLIWNHFTLLQTTILCQVWRECRNVTLKGPPSMEGHSRHQLVCELRLDFSQELQTSLPRMIPKLLSHVNVTEEWYLNHLESGEILPSVNKQTSWISYFIHLHTCQCCHCFTFSQHARIAAENAGTSRKVWSTPRSPQVRR